MASLIQHVWVDESIDTLEFLRKRFSLSEPSSEALLNIGAVYRNKKRLAESVRLSPGDYLRIHLDPKRYQVPTPLSASLIFENDDYAVLNKPRGLPIHATVDNAIENALAELTREKRNSFYVTHRLDVDTEGLVVLAKTKAFQKRFNELLLKRKVRKQYLAITENFVQPGYYLHFQKPSERAPKEIVSEPKETYLPCELTILSCTKINDSYYETKVELITGRTHQIRCQLAYMGSPLRGDSLYGSPWPGPYQLKAFFLSFENYSHTIESNLVCKNESDLKTMTPSRGNFW